MPCDYPSSDSGLYNGFESEQELCDNYIAYLYDCSFIDSGLCRHVIIFDEDSRIMDVLLHWVVFILQIILEMKMF